MLDMMECLYQHIKYFCKYLINIATALYLYVLIFRYKNSIYSGVNMGPSVIQSITDKLYSLCHQHIEDDLDIYHDVCAIVHEYSSAIKKLESEDCPKEEIKTYLTEARNLHSKSSFISRLQTWPRGYQGDFETIEYLCQGVNKAPNKTIEWHLENMALFGTIAQQHKNKLHWQAQSILDCLYNSVSEGNILIISCGGCVDLRSILSHLSNSNVNIVINDADDDAIHLAHESLDQCWDNIIPITGNCFKKLRDISKHGPYQLILTGGLFDYLSDKYICKLIKHLNPLLAPKGRICFTNVLKPNPWRIWMEYFAEWTLIERNKEDFIRMFSNAGFDDLELKMLKDETSLTGLYELHAA